MTGSPPPKAEPPVVPLLETGGERVGQALIGLGTGAAGRRPSF